MKKALSSRPHLSKQAAQSRCGCTATHMRFCVIQRVASAAWRYAKRHGISAISTKNRTKCAVLASTTTWRAHAIISA
ncbi:MAG: hypothetical protein A3B29_05295 [Candidatus Sungbacteria bacterium RIFCSPLOWO2_01_FULL_51_34]|nr:MAG: hypothetical protein A3B29_05295 [Candidatus Sungbacteria bacterium RIFCSPLOWO2_01_FULL_51_34]